MPAKFWWFITENGNTLHDKLTEQNIENFLAVFEWDNAIKDKIRNQFKENAEKQEIKVGERYEGTVDTIKDFGVFIKVKKWNNTQSWLLHTSEMKNKKFNTGETVNVVVKNITPEWKVGFTLAPKETLTMDKIKVGDVFSGTISNISKNNLVFVKINTTNISWLLKTGIDKEHIKEIFELDTAVKVKVIRKDEKWLSFKITI